MLSSVVLAVALLCLAFGFVGSNEIVVDAPVVTPQVPHTCIHDDDTLQNLLYHHGADSVAPQTYKYITQSHHFHTLAVNNIRIAISSLDLFNSTQYCATVGQQVSDMQGGTATCTADDILTDAKRDILLNQVIPAAIKMHTDRMKVTPISGNLVVPSSSCSYFTIPTSHRTTGVADADLVLYVAAAKTSGNTIAWAGACNYDQLGRPVVGRMNYGPKYITNASWHALDQIVRVGAHEIGHALGFSNGYLNFYKPQYIPTVSTRGKTTLGHNGSSVSAAVQNFFQCPTIGYAEFEDEGGNGTIKSHWERRNHYQDLMSGVSGDYAYYSNITMAYFQDLGVYTMDFTKAEVPSYGKGLGCSFLSEKCLGGANPATTTLFCNDTSGTSYCTNDHLGLGPCSTGTFASALPSYFQYFSDPTMGGTSSCTDYCPMVESYSNRKCNETGSDPNNTIWGTYYGDGGRCVTVSSHVIQSGYSASSYPAAMCVKMRCLEGTQVQFLVGSQSSWNNCPANGSAATVSAGPGYVGTIECPVASTICTADLFYSATTAVPSTATPTTGTPTTGTPTTGTPTTGTPTTGTPTTGTPTTGTPTTGTPTTATPTTGTPTTATPTTGTPTTATPTTGTPTTATPTTGTPTTATPTTGTPTTATPTTGTPTTATPTTGTPTTATPTTGTPTTGAPTTATPTPTTATPTTGTPTTGTPTTITPATAVPPTTAVPSSQFLVRFGGSKWADALSKNTSAVTAAAKTSIAHSIGFNEEDIEITEIKLV